MFGQDRLNHDDEQVKAALILIKWLVVLFLAMAPLLVRNQ